MKKILATILCLVVLGIAAVPAGAQTPYRQNRQRTYQTYQTRTYDAPRYDYRWNDNRSTWDKHQDKFTTAAGAVGGAILGGLLGGGKGAAIGALVGGGGAALYTYKLRDKNHYYHY